MGAQGPAREGTAADHRLLPLPPLSSQTAPPPRVSVLLPCRDEEAQFPRYPAELLPALEGLGRPWELLVIDDGSSDGTLARARELAAREPRARVLALRPGRGLGGALRAGFAEARGEWIATLDADLTFRPGGLAVLLAAAEASGADLAAGSPFLRPGDLERVPWPRRLPSLLVNALYRGLFGLALTAYTPVLRLYRADRLRELPLSAEGFEINAEIAARAMLRRWRVVEAPCPLEAREGGASKLRAGRELARHAALILRLLAGA